MCLLQLIMLFYVLTYLIIKNIVSWDGFLMSAYPVYQDVTGDISLVFANLNDINWILKSISIIDSLLLLPLHSK